MRLWLDMSGQFNPACHLEFLLSGEGDITQGTSVCSPRCFQSIYRGCQADLFLTFPVWALGVGQFCCYWTSEFKMILIQI